MNSHHRLFRCSPRRLLMLTTATCAMAACSESASKRAKDQPAQTPATSATASVPAATTPEPVAQAPIDRSIRIPLATGLTLVSVLHHDTGDRENVVVVREVSNDGVLYAWRFREAGSGDGETSLERFVRATDLASAPRFNSVFTRQGRDDTPGYTSFSISRGTYARLHDEGRAPFTITELDGGPLGAALGGLLSSRVTRKGTLELASREPVPFPVLLNGRRVHVAALHLRGEFGPDDEKARAEYWVLADSTHPLLLKHASEKNVLQTVRIDAPFENPAVPTVERELEQGCRAELPGIYFGFGTAELESASAPAIDSVAALLRRHPDWSLAIEGHTDDIGSAAANQALSLGRADAVRAALSRGGIAPSRLSATGFGATRPREPNATLEGRARNRRVELVRSCAASD